MANNILMSDCAWCGEPYIKEAVGQMHGCAAEREKPTELNKAAAEAGIPDPSEGIITLVGR